MDDLRRSLSVDVKGLFEEIINFNEHTWFLQIPLQTLYDLFSQVTSRCNEINDPRLNELMLRLNLYETSNDKRAKMIKKMIEEQEK